MESPRIGWHFVSALIDQFVEEKIQQLDIELDMVKYLQRLLDKEPKELVKNYEMDSKNNQAAIALLKERYDDKEKISRRHLNSFMNIKRLLERMTLKY